MPFLHSGARMLTIASTLDRSDFTPFAPIMMPMLLSCDFLSCIFVRWNFTFTSWARLNSLFSVRSASSSLLHDILFLHLTKFELQSVLEPKWNPSRWLFHGYGVFFEFNVVKVFEATQPCTYIFVCCVQAFNCDRQ